MNYEIGDKGVIVSDDGVEIVAKGNYIRFNLIESEQLKRVLDGN